MLINATNDSGGLAVEDMVHDTSTVINFVEGGLILVVVVIGLTTNILSILALIRHKSFRNSFGYITAYHALCNAAILFIFAIWAIPWTISAIPENMQPLNLRIGQLSLFFVETAFHCCLFLSINRFLAISYPTRYRQLFTDKVTVITIIFVSLISAFYWAIYFVEGCNFYFDHEYRVWSFGSEPCGVFLSFYIDMAYNVCLFLLVGIIDIATLMQLRSTTKSFLSHLLQKKKQVQDTMLRRRRKEILFFMQTFMNSLTYAFMLVCFHLISRTVSTDFQLFLCTTFIWGFSHAAGGVILIVFNPEVRRHLLNFRTPKKSMDAISAASTARHQPTTIAVAARQYPTTYSRFIMNSELIVDALL